MGGTFNDVKGFGWYGQIRTPFAWFGVGGVGFKFLSRELRINFSFY